MSIIFDKIFKGFLGLIIILIILIIAFNFLGLISCQSSPDKKDFEVRDCFYSADCMYRNQKNPDKSGCAIIYQACCDALKEARAKLRIEYCKTPPAGMTEEICRLTLNQK